jgi:hypothetical protein
METQFMGHVEKEDFVEFAKAVKQELTNRIASDPWVKKQSDEIRKYQAIRDTYKQINSLEK